MCHFEPLGKLNVADLHGGVTLAMPALNLILAAILLLKSFYFRSAKATVNFPGHFRLGGVLAPEEFCFVGTDGHDIFERDRATDFSIEALDLDGLTRLHAVLLAPTSNYGVHACS